MHRWSVICPVGVVARNVHRLVSVAEFVGRAIERCARPEGIVVSTGLGEITELTDRSFRAVRDILEEHGTVPETSEQPPSRSTTSVVRAGTDA